MPPEPVWYEDEFRGQPCQHVWSASFQDGLVCWDCGASPSRAQPKWHEMTQEEVMARAAERRWGRHSPRKAEKPRVTRRQSAPKPSKPRVTRRQSAPKPV